MRRILGICGIVVVLAAGCGLFDDDRSPDLATDVTPGTGPTGSIIDQQLAEDTMLTPADFTGPDWQVDQSSDEFGAAVAELVPGCKAIHEANTLAEETRTGYAGPFTMVNNDLRLVRAQVSVFPDVDAATEVMTAIEEADAAGCTEAMTSNVPGLAGTPSETSSEPPDSFGDKIVSSQVVYPDAGERVDLASILESHWIQVDRVVVQLEFAAPALAALDTTDYLELLTARAVANVNAG